MPIFGAKSRAARGCASKLACGRRIDPRGCTSKIARFTVNCNNHQICVGEGFYPSRRHTVTNLGVPMRNGAHCVVAVHCADLRVRSAREGQSPSPTACREMLRFYVTLWEICHCSTGGQGRPPLQNVLRCCRWRVQFCNCVLPGRCGHRPLRTYFFTIHSYFLPQKRETAPGVSRGGKKK